MPRIMQTPMSVVEELDIKNIDEADVLNCIFYFITKTNLEQDRIQLYPIVRHKKWAVQIELKGLVSNIATAPRFTWLQSEGDTLHFNWLTDTPAPKELTLMEFRMDHKTIEEYFLAELPLWEKKI